MSNRRKLPSEKAARVRCRHCRYRDLSRKVFTDGAVALICDRCGHVTTSPKPDDEQEAS